MIGRTDTRHLVAAEEKGVLSFVGQRPDAPFGKAVVYRIIPVLSVKENLIPIMVEVIDCLPHQTSVSRRVYGFHQIQQASHLYEYLCCLGRVPHLPYLFRAEFPVLVFLLQCVEPSMYSRNLDA